MKTFHAIMAIFWTAMMPLSALTDLKHSVPYLVFISVYALAAAHAAGWAGERAKKSADAAQPNTDQTHTDQVPDQQPPTQFPPT